MSGRKWRAESAVEEAESRLRQKEIIGERRDMVAQEIRQGEGEL